MKTLQIKNKSEDSDLLIRARDLKFGSFHIKTPKFAFDIRKRDPAIPLANDVFGINELNRNIRSTTVKKHLRESNLSQFNYEFKNQRIKLNSDEIMLCFLCYESEKFIPERNEIGFLLDTSYEYSDIVPIIGLQNIPDKLSDIEFQHYLDYIQMNIDILNTLNSKPIMGIIPRIGYQYLKPIIDLYVKNEVYAFSIDLRNASITSNHQLIRVILRSIIENEVFDQSYIHVLNPNKGRQIKQNPVINAKDILSLGFGIDSFSQNHRQLKAPAEFFDNIKNKKERKTRIFIKEDYGYHNLSTDDTLSVIFPSDSYFNYEYISKSPDQQAEIKVFNMEQLSLEANIIRKQLDQGKFGKYLEDKENVNPQDIKIMRKIKSEMKGERNQKKITQFFNELF